MPELPGIKQDACQFRNWLIYRIVTSLAVFRLRYCGAATGGSRTKTVSKFGFSPNRSNLVLAFSAGLRLIVPKGNEAEASLACTRVYPASSLTAITAHLAGREPIVAAEKTNPGRIDPGSNDLQDVRGQQHAKRALEITAAGGHNLLLTGPPGTGRRISGVQSQCT